MLPGEHERGVRPPQAYRIAIGHMEKNREGKTYPAGDDFFSIRRLSMQAKERPTYVVDQALQEALCAQVGIKDGKPTVCPVSVLGNPIPQDYVDSDGNQRKRMVLPPSILWARMARYWGGRCLCYCEEFDAEQTGKATQRVWKEHSKTRGEKTTKWYTLAEEKRVDCDPKNCPWATGMHGQSPYEGTPLCKPQIIASFTLPFAPVTGSVAQFRSTGWHSYFALRDSLLLIAAENGGWLHQLPFRLIFGYAAASSGRTVPAIRVEFAGEPRILRATTEKVQSEYLGQERQLVSAQHDLKQLQAGIVEGIIEDLQDPAQEEAFQAEFQPEGDRQPLPADVLEGEVEKVAEGETETEEEGAPEELPAEPSKEEPAFDLPLATEASLTDKMAVLEWDEAKQKAALAGLKSMADAGKLAQELVAELKGKRNGKVEQLQMGGEKDA